MRRQAGDACILGSRAEFKAPRVDRDRIERRRYSYVSTRFWSDLPGLAQRVVPEVEVRGVQVILPGAPGIQLEPSRAIMA